MKATNATADIPPPPRTVDDVIAEWRVVRGHLGNPDATPYALDLVVDEITRLRAERDQMAALLTRLTKPGFLAFLDGRNDQGTHIAESYPQTMPATEALADDPQDTCEHIMSAAEAMGFREGDFVWTTWTWFKGQYGPEHRCEIAPCWEFDGIDLELTRAFAPQGKPNND